MTVTEESRHRLHQALDQAIGPEEATTLMEHLPPIGWADVATKADVDVLRTQDLAHLQQVIEARFEVIDGRFDQQRADVDHRFHLERAHTDGRFDLIEQRFDGIDQRFDGIDQRFDGIDQRFDDMRRGSDTRLDDMRLGSEARFDEVVRRLEGIETRLTQQFWQFLTIVVAFGAILLGLLRFT